MASRALLQSFNHFALILVSAAFLSLIPGPALADGNVTYELASIFNESPETQVLCVGCTQVEVAPEIYAFYRDRYFTPVWVDDDGPDSLAMDFLEALVSSRDHGLNPADYQTDCLSSWMERFWGAQGEGNGPDGRDLAGLDILLTSVFFRFAEHMGHGRVNPASLYALWRPEENRVDPAAVLDRLEGHGDISRTIRELAPPHEQYWSMVDAGRKLAETVEKGGWPGLPRGIRLELGDEGPDVALLRERLIAGGDLIPSTRDFADLFDADVQTAVRTFQERHGLTVDGIVDKATLAALSVSAEERLVQVRLNIERWRWFARDFGPRYVIVNPPAFSLTAFDGDRKALEMRVIVGKVATQTPVFSDTIEYMEVNPFWYVPRSIAVNMSKKNLSGRGYQSYGSGAIVQRPGPGNALGRIKFVFPNRYSVYMHDTPSRYLFARDYRAYSHGCIRLHRPVDLAVFLRRENLDWNEDTVWGLIRKGATERIPVATESKVHIVYLTAWVGEDGELNFRGDLYHRDPILARALAHTDEPREMAGTGNGVTSGPCSRLTASSGDSGLPQN